MGHDWFKEWLRKPGRKKAYVRRIARLHELHPDAGLAELRGHARKGPATPDIGDSDAYRRALLFLNYRRSGATKRQAERKAGITAQRAYKLTHGAFEVSPSGKIVPKRSDRLARPLIFYDQRGQISIWVRSSRGATLIGEYHNEVERWLHTGNSGGLRRFVGKSVRDIDGVRHPFITDTRTLRRFARAGEVRFTSIYAFVGDV